MTFGRIVGYSVVFSYTVPNCRGSVRVVQHPLHVCVVRNEPGQMFQGPLIALPLLSGGGIIPPSIAEIMFLQFEPNSKCGGSWQWPIAAGQNLEHPVGCKAAAVMACSCMDVELCCAGLFSGDCASFAQEPVRSSALLCGGKLATEALMLTVTLQLKPQRRLGP